MTQTTALMTSLRSMALVLLGILSPKVNAFGFDFNIDPDMNRDKPTEPHHSLTTPMDQGRVSTLRYKCMPTPAALGNKIDFEGVTMGF